MAITFPRPLPDVVYTDVDPVLDMGVVSAAAGKRRINHTQVRDPAWTISLTTRSLSYSDYAAVEAWWLSLRGGLRTVLFRNPNICFPRAHGKDQAPAAQTGNLVSITDSNKLSVNGLSPALLLTGGDFVGLERNGLYYLGRVVDVAGAGGSRTIEVEPPPLGPVGLAGAVVRFASPALLTRAVPDSFEKSKTATRFVASFQLVEV